MFHPHKSLSMNKISLFAIALALPLACQAQNVFTSPTLTIEPIEAEPGGTIRAYTVSANGIHRLEVSELPGETASASDATVTLLPEQKYQTIDGFGFAITGSTGYNLSKMKAEDRRAFLTRTFSPEHGYGASYVRVPIGCSDFSLSNYTCCDTPGIENFALTDEETKYIIPALKEILEINPSVKIISSPWTPPRWMKTNGNWTAGHLKPECYQDYATYFVKWIKAFAEYGIHITAVCPQNESLQRYNSASMVMEWTEARDFIKQALGPKFREEGIDTQIYVYDHDYDYCEEESQKDYPTRIYEDADASQYITGAAFHSYGGDASEMSNVHNANPDKKLIFTETTAGEWNAEGVRISVATNDIKWQLLPVLKNWGCTFLVWNLMLDSERGPYRPGGCSTANGAVDIMKTDYATITYNSYYYIVCLASVGIPVGSVRIGTSGDHEDVGTVAFRTPEGGYSLLLNNTSASPRAITVAGPASFTVTVDANSAKVLTWK